MENKELLCENQFGLRSGYNTIDAASVLARDVAEALDRSQSTAAVFCDLSRAFDCVDHKL